MIINNTKWFDIITKTLKAHNQKVCMTEKRNNPQYDYWLLENWI